MIKEAYCSFELSKLLREKGFNEGCPTTYMYNGLFHTNNYKPLFSDILAPTHQMAMRWIRETYDIFIEIKRDNQFYQGYAVTPMTKHDKERGHKNEYYAIILDSISNSRTTERFDTFEEAVEAALKEVLENMI